MLCLDKGLSDLPLEAMACLKDCAVSRDFSLPFHLDRLAEEGPNTIDSGKMKYFCDPRNEDIEGSSGTVHRDDGLPPLSQGRHSLNSLNRAVCIG